MNKKLKKRILSIDVAYKTGSTGKLVHEIHKRLSEYYGNEFESFVAYGRGKKVSERNVLKTSFDLETMIHVLLNRITGLHGVYSYFSTLRLIKYIKKIQPDVVHLHELHGYFVNINMLLKYIKSRKIPIVWTFHCEYMYTGKGHVYSKEELPNWNKKSEYPKSLFFDFTDVIVKKYLNFFLEYDKIKITYPSSWVESRLENTLLNKLSRRVIPNFVDVTKYKPCDYSRIEKKYGLTDKKVILSVAPNITDVTKGGKWVIEIAKSFQNRKDTVFVILGINNAKNLPKMDNVLYINKTDDHDTLIELYSKASCFLLTSLRETFSMVSLESLSCGTPVIGFQAGAPEMVFKEPFGRFVPYGDVSKLKSLLLSVLNEKKCIVCNRNFVINYFKSEEVIDQYVALYREFD